MPSSGLSGIAVAHFQRAVEINRGLGDRLPDVALKWPNDVLFDLVRGCDLTYISDFGWKEWHREPQEVPFDTFAEAIGNGGIRRRQPRDAHERPPLYPQPRTRPLARG